MKSINVNQFIYTTVTQKNNIRCTGFVLNLIVVYKAIGQLIYMLYFLFLKLSSI